MPQPDADVLGRFLARASRRVTLILAVHGATTGFGLALVVTLIRRWQYHGAIVPAGVLPLGFVALGVVLGAIRGRSLRRDIASIVETKAPACRNVVVTASELLNGRSKTGAYAAELVYADAARKIGALRINTLFPMRNAVTALVATAAIWTFVVTRPAALHGTMAERGRATGTRAAITGVDVTVILPAYIGQTRSIVRDPARIEALVGSTIRVEVHADAATVAIETLHGRTALRSTGGGTFTGDVPADADGFISIEPATAAGSAGTRRLIGVSVTPDQPPRVHVTAPGHDIKLQDGHHTIAVAIEADDDIGLASLHLKYTRVSGSGERFTFTSGEVPLAVTRTDKRTWKAHASWRLDSLALGPGDMVVYRAVAADDRPGAAPTESDSYIAEVLAPGGIAAAGFAMDPEVERYALSEQMVILKTQQLDARKAPMAVDSFRDAAAEIAAEQRRVRAEFVFMMGGEVGGADDATGDLNEVAEASGEGDLAAARLLNQGRAALLSAIRYMSRADKALTTPDLALALTSEKGALAQLELTFSHNHILLRALTEHERIDLTRRLSGALTDVTSNSEPVVPVGENQRRLALRTILGDIQGLAYFRTMGDSAASKAVVVAERVLRLDASSKPGQLVAAQLDSTAIALRGGRVDAARVLLDRAAMGVTGMLRSDLPGAALVVPTGDVARLAGALTDVLRRKP